MAESGQERASLQQVVFLEIASGLGLGRRVIAECLLCGKGF